MRYALGIEYAGFAFCGFQSQPARCGIQDALEDALGEVAGHPLGVVAAGRTDAGVHAVSQIVHFDTEAVRPDSAWVRGVNTHLPGDAAVLWARPVAAEFHARFAATARHYTYVLLTRGERPGLLAKRVGWYHRPLDIDAMRAGAAYLAGSHDFSAFRAAQCQAKSPVKTLARLAIAHEGPFVRFDFSANAFLHHMIRNIIGALIYVGAGRQPPDWIADLLAARDRTRAAPTFAAEGLYFAGADYDARFGLPPTVRPVLLAAAGPPQGGGPPGGRTPQASSGGPSSATGQPQGGSPHGGRTPQASSGGPSSAAGPPQGGSPHGERTPQASSGGPSSAL